MILKRLKLLFIFSSIIFPMSYVLANSGEGKVTMNGEIIDTACAIEMDSAEQTIDMGILPTGVIRQMGVGPVRHVDIYLVNCSLEQAGDSSKVWSNLRVTFDGASTDHGLFDVFGEARGVALYMEDADNRQVIPGEALPEQTIVPPTMRLSYTLRLAANHQTLRPGPYQSIIRFKIDYQ